MWRAGISHCDYEVLPRVLNLACVLIGIILKIPLLSGVGFGTVLFAPGGSHRDQVRGKGGLGDGERGSSLIPEWNGSPQVEQLRLIYGCTNLRMTEMPILDD